MEGIEYIGDGSIEVKLDEYDVEINGVLFFVYFVIVEENNDI